MPTEGCRGAVRYRSDGLVTAIKQECLNMSFKTMFRIAQHDFCSNTAILLQAVDLVSLTITLNMTFVNVISLIESSCAWNSIPSCVS